MMSSLSTTCQDICVTAFYSKQPHRKHGNGMVTIRKYFKNVNKNNKQCQVAAWNKTQGQIKAVFTQHQGRRFTLLVQTFFTTAAQSARAIPCPLFTIFLQAIISQTPAILDAWVSSKIASCLSLGHEGKDVVVMRVRNVSFLLTDVLCSVLTGHWT